MQLEVRKIIQEIYEEISEGSLVFANENQFQFELAWRIKTKYSGYDVLFEVVYLDDNRSSEKDKKNYTDLVVVDNDLKEYVSIELKYKTKQRDSDDRLLKNQGAQDLGVYDYLKDLSRIEKLKENSLKQFEFYEKYKDYKFDKGYAIILTNDKTYYEGGKEEKYAMYFSIKHNAKKAGEMDWNRNLGKCVKGTDRDYPIFLSGNYDCIWNLEPDKNKNSGKEFYYLILEV